MKFQLLLLWVTSLFTTYQSENTHQLTVKVSNIEELTGTVRVCLIGNNEEKYLKGCEYASVAVVRGNTVKVEFDELLEGQYCVYVFHDVNGDTKLDTNGLFGMPSEPYGFSNNPSTFFGPPKLSQCLFEVSKNREIEIELK